MWYMARSEGWTKERRLCWIQAAAVELDLLCDCSRSCLKKSWSNISLAYVCLSAGNIGLGGGGVRNSSQLVKERLRAQPGMTEERD